MINIFDFFQGIRLVNPFKSHTPSPAEFRRRKVKNSIGFSVDRNSQHIGNFSGDITPMKRRFKGVSRTANPRRK